MLKIGVCGICGRMGKMICELTAENENMEVASAIEREGHEMIGKDISEVMECSHAGVAITSDVDAAVNDADCIIDFTFPEPTIEHLKSCVNKKKSMVIGTTALSVEQEDMIKQASKEIPIVYSPNMSVGMNVLFKIIKEATKILAGEYDIKVDETHHVHKKDSPSGTAKMIASIIKEVSGETVEIEAFREGEVVGNHGVLFNGKFETLEIRHDARSRHVFVQGALKAALFLKDKGPGLYNMSDVLGI